MMMDQLTSLPVIDEHVVYSNVLAVRLLQSVDDFTERQFRLLSSNLCDSGQCKLLQGHENIHMYSDI